MEAFNKEEDFNEGYLRIHHSKAFPDSLVNLFDYFGNIYEKPFDEWWRENQSRYLHDQVEDYSPIIGKEIASLYSVFEYLNEPEPSAEDFKKDFISRMNTTDQNSLYLKITVTKNGGIDQLMKKIKEMLKEKKKEVELELCPTKPIRQEELRRYLRVYDLRASDLKWREVAERIYPKRRLDESLERSLYIDLGVEVKI